MTKWRVLGVATALGIAASGCAGVVKVGASVSNPAEIPIRAFPRVVLVPGLGDYDRQIADALALHLASTGLGDVQVEPPGAIDRAGRGAPGTAIVHVNVALTATGRTEWITRQETTCGAVGCYSTPRTSPVHTPVAEARLFVIVRDGGTGRELQEAVLVARSSASTHTYMERAIVRDLSEQVRRAVDVRQQRVRVEILEVEHEAAEPAVARLREGAWREGGELFEAFLASGAAGSLPAEERARAYYDLGMARRFDSTETADPDARFASGRAALERAIALDPGESRYVTALTALDEHRERARILREQAVALDHNRALLSRAPPVDVRTAASPAPAITIPVSYQR